MASSLSSELPAFKLRKPLCVDLDGTLLRTDSFVESLLSRIRREPGAVLRLLLLLLTERLKAKAMTARDFVFAAATPLNPGVLDLLRRERASGRYLVLATGAHEDIARRVSGELQLFDEVLASNSECNLTGRRKLALLERRFGRGGFEYIGNSFRDVAVWRSCGAAIVAEPSLAARVALRILRLPTHEIASPSRSMGRLLAQCLRIHQWSKNLLVLVPLLLSHKIFEAPRLLASIQAALAFCFIASGGYLVNDILDLDADRRHPEKCTRPLARGDCSVTSAITLAAISVAAGLGLAFAVSLPLACLLGAYLVVSIVYSSWLKRLVLVDIFFLVLFYCARVLAGAVAAGLHVSPWLIQFILFCFFSLAAGKRVAELLTLVPRRESVERRGYAAGDIDLLTSFGIVSGFLSVLIVALYVNSPEVLPLYRRSYLLWFLCPLLLYWFSRLWMVIRRGGLKGDPVSFAFRDRPTWIAGGLGTLILLAAL